MASASITISSRILSATDQPTIFREYPSITVARYAHPLIVKMYVMSPYHSWFFSAGTKSRPTRSTRPAAFAGSCSVVALYGRGCTQARPAAQWPCFKVSSGIVTVSWRMMVLKGSLRTAGCRTGSRSVC